MRRVTLMLAAVAMMVSLFAVVAYAADIQGTDDDEALTESNRNDVIRGHRGPDIINAREFLLSETPGGLGDTDNVKGNRGDDDINADDGDILDKVNGGSGTDECTVDRGEVTKSCEVIIQN
jgi:hypothetical protein